MILIYLSVITVVSTWTSWYGFEKLSAYMKGIKRSNEIYINPEHVYAYVETTHEYIIQYDLGSKIGTNHYEKPSPVAEEIISGAKVYEENRGKFKFVDLDEFQVLCKRHKISWLDVKSFVDSAGKTYYFNLGDFKFCTRSKISSEHLRRKKSRKDQALKAESQQISENALIGHTPQEIEERNSYDKIGGVTPIGLELSEPPTLEEDKDVVSSHNRIVIALIYLTRVTGVGFKAVFNFLIGR